MITGQIKSQINQIWETFCTGGITNSITLPEQMIYLMFMKMDDVADGIDTHHSKFHKTGEFVNILQML